MGRGALIEEDDEEDEFVYQAVISYMCPLKAAVGIRASNREEAEEIVLENFGTYLDFQLVSLEPATPEQLRQLEGNIKH